MNLRTDNLLLAIAAVLLMVPNALAQGGPPAPSYAGTIIKQAGIKPQFGKKLPLDATFVNADGKTIRLGDCFNGRPVILHLVYYECPMLCKLSSDGLLSTLSTLSLKPGEDFSIVTISFDSREGPEFSSKARDMAISRYGKERVAKGWQFLTGSQDSIDVVTKAAGFQYVFDKNTKQYAHASGIFIITPDGTIARYLGGINYTPRDVRFAIMDASEGKVGTVADQVMMLCYMYDPTLGKYGFAIISVIRISGVLTVGALAAGIITMVRRDRRRNYPTASNEPSTE